MYSLGLHRVNLFLMYNALINRIAGSSVVVIFFAVAASHITSFLSMSLSSYTNAQLLYIRD